MSVICAHPYLSVANPRVSLGHAQVDNCSFEQAQSAILAHASVGGDSACIMTVNAHHVVLLDQDAHLREAYSAAALVVPDGVSMLLASHLMGSPLTERVVGVDLFQSLCAASASANLKVFFLGGSPGAANLSANLLRQRHPGFQVQTHCPPIGFEKDPAELDRIDTIIRAFRPNIVFVGLGAPKQEYWMHHRGRHLGASVLIGIGGSFELVSGIIKRAPRWLQSLGLEWLFRLCMEPRRLWRRYLIGNFQFLSIILRQRLSQTSS